MTLTVSVEASGELHPPETSSIPLQIIDLLYENSRYSQAGLVEIEALADRTAQQLYDNTILDTGVSVSINDTRVGSGLLHDLSVTEEGVIEITAVDATRNLHQNVVGHEFRNTRVETVLERIFEAANIEEVDGPGDWLNGRPGYHIEAEPVGPVVGEPSPDPGGPIDEGWGPLVHRNFNDTKCIEALNTIMEEFNWYWYVDENNVINIVESIDPDVHSLEYILETTAGKQTPPYQRVIVYGGTNEQAPPPDSESGVGTAEESRRHLLSRAPVMGQAGSGEPTFKYRDKSLTTQTKANAVARSIKDEFERQQASGEVTVVGDPSIRPMDAIQMPDDMGGEGYIVSSIEQTANGDDGFQTTIGCGGLLQGELD